MVMIEIATPYRCAAVGFGSIRFFHPRDGAAEDAWVCLDDLLNACGLPHMHVRAVLARYRDMALPELVRTVRTAGTRLTVATYRNSLEVLGLLEGEGWVAKPLADEVATTLVDGLEHQIVDRFAHLVSPLRQHDEVMAFYEARRRHHDDTPSLFPLMIHSNGSLPGEERLGA